MRNLRTPRHVTSQHHIQVQNKSHRRPTRHRIKPNNSNINRRSHLTKPTTILTNLIISIRLRRRIRQQTHQITVHHRHHRRFQPIRNLRPIRRHHNLTNLIQLRITSRVPFRPLPHRHNSLNNHFLRMILTRHTLPNHNRHNRIHNQTHLKRNRRPKT